MSSRHNQVFGTNSTRPANGNTATGANSILSVSEPKTLYKYVNAQRALNCMPEVGDGTLRATQPAALNNPFECAVVPRYVFRNKAVKGGGLLAPVLAFLFAALFNFTAGYWLAASLTILPVLAVMTWVQLEKGIAPRVKPFHRPAAPNSRPGPGENRRPGPPCRNQGGLSRLGDLLTLPPFLKPPHFKPQNAGIAAQGPIWADLGPMKPIVRSHSPWL